MRLPGEPLWIIYVAESWRVPNYGRAVVRSVCTGDMEGGVDVIHFPSRLAASFLVIMVMGVGRLE
jgi:hypothetical protein